MEHVRLLQVNLQHNKTASDMLSRFFNTRRLDIVLVQEPYVHGGLVRRLATTTGRVVYCRGEERPRAALLLKAHIKYLTLPQFISRDLVAVQAVVPTSGGWQEVIIASAYFPGDSEDSPPPTEVRNLVHFCKQRNRGLLLGCDANAHHIVWGSTDVNGRGECLFEYLCQTNLDILNRGTEPTFLTKARQEVLDLTLATPLISTKIVNWHVSREASFSDHRYIIFDLKTEGKRVEEVRVPKLTDWILYEDQLRSELEGTAIDVKDIEDLERASVSLHNIIHKAYEEHCPLKLKRSNTKISWWNKDLEILRSKARRLFNIAKRTKRQEKWDLYREALTKFNKELRRSKRKSWRSFCEDMNNMPAVARIQKVLAKDHSNQLGHLQKANGTFTESAGEMLELLLSTHFPGAHVITASDADSAEEARLATAHFSGIRRLANNIFTPDRVKWAILSFKPFKSPGEDGIIPALLQRGIDVLTPFLCSIFRGSLRLSHIPNLWRGANVVFIPKGGGRSSALAKSWRPISLTSFMLKSMEKVLDQYLRYEVLVNAPLHKNQHAYQKAKSTTTALHGLVLNLEETLEAKEIALCAFMDIEGAFDNTSFEAIEDAAVKKGFHPAITAWIKSMLSGRRVKATVAGESTTIGAGKGCPQGGVLSPLLWSLVADDLLNKLTDNGYVVQGYADDLVIIIRGQMDAIVSQRMQRALNITQTWCLSKGLRINPEKTVVVPFTRRRKLNLTAPLLEGKRIEFKKEVKYLGVILDQKLTWNSHLNKVRAKAAVAIHTCRRLMGRNWGLKPGMIHWSYTAIIRPIVTYAALVWWPKTEQGTAQKLLRRIQRLACLSITGAMSTCPTTSMEAMLNLLPLHLQVQREAANGALLISRLSKNKPSKLKGHLRILRVNDLEKMAQLPTDAMTVRFNFEQNYKIKLLDQESGTSGGPSGGKGTLHWYTDGSKQNSGSTGAGISGPNCRISVPMGHFATIFQAEVFAINLCVLTNLNKGLKGATINIHTDSQSALKALAAYACDSKLVWECISNLKLLAKDNHITLRWVPGHKGITGNEKADELAKKGANLPLIGPEPFCGVTKYYTKEHISNREKHVKASIWSCAPGQKQAKKFITISPKKARVALSLSKGDLAILTGLYTGHYHLKYHLHKIGKAEEGICRLCNESAETAEHLMCQCPATCRLRLKILGKATTTTTDIREAEPSRIIRFFKSLDLPKI